MAKKRLTHIDIGGKIIKIREQKKGDFISLTDMVQGFEGDVGLIEKWLRNKNTIEFLGIWEKLNNPYFSLSEFEGIYNDAGTNRFMLSVKKWVEETGAIGIEARSGRYGGTYAHKDIAIQFASWLSPTFYLYLVTEFQRLKEEEAQRQNLEWDVRRIMAKANYRIHTEAVREHLIPPRLQYTKMEGLYFANEADILNMALFGMTAKEWRQQNPDKKGNIRDNATAEQLLVLSNLQSLNAKLMKWDCDQEQRLQILNEAAIEEMQILLSSTSLKALPEDKKKGLDSGKQKKS
jgi:hypothetical protein